MPGPALPATLRFARVARVLNDAAHRLGLVAPGFRSPPGLPGSDRTIRRADRGAVVAVRLRGRPFEAVVADMVDGVVAANHLDPDASRRVRVLLTQAVLRDGFEPTDGTREAA